MPLLRESVTHWPINWQSALIPSPSQELFFWSLFCRTDNVRESLELAEGTYLSHMTALIPLGTLRSLLALNTLPTNQGPAYRPATLRDTFSSFFLCCCPKMETVFRVIFYLFRNSEGAIRGHQFYRVWGNLLFSLTLYFGHTKWITRLFFNNTQQRKFLFAALWRFVLGAARLVVFRLAGCLRRNGLAGCWKWQRVVGRVREVFKVTV